MAKKRTGKPDIGSEGSDVKKTSRADQTSIRVNKALARKLTVLAKHKGVTAPELVETWLRDRVTEAYQAMIEDLKREFGED